MAETDFETQIHELFYEMEEDYNLFELTSDKELPFWDVVRSDVYIDLQFPDFVASSGISSNHAPLISKIKGHLKVFFYFFKFLLLKYDDLFFANSRFKDSGISYDPYLRSVQGELSDRVIVYETSYATNKYSYKDMVFNILPLCYKFGLPSLFFKDNKLEANLQKMCDAYHDKFGIPLDKNKYRSMYIRFLFDFSFYKRIFKIKNIKRIFILQNGVQKGLFLAARNLNIPTFEFQHGDIVDATIVYNYYKLTSDIINNIIAPKYFLTFSGLWTADKNIPAICIETGNDFLYVDKVEKNNEKCITIISSLFHNDDLADLTLGLAKSKPDYNIFFKLHPAQFLDFEEIKAFFKEVGNVEVIAYQKNIGELIRLSDEFIAIFSTAIFEVVQSGKTVYLYKKQNYLSFKRYFNLPNVYPFDDLGDLLSIKSEIGNFSFSGDTPQFFKKFDKKKFAEVIKAHS